MTAICNNWLFGCPNPALSLMVVAIVVIALWRLFKK